MQGGTWKRGYMDWSKGRLWLVMVKFSGATFGMISPLSHFILERGIQAKGRVKGLCGMFEKRTGPKRVRGWLSKRDP